MQKKKPSAIKKITLNRATYHNETIDHLSYVNFFYGNNGTGKTTIARCIEDGDGVEWTEGRSPEDFEIAVYDRDFIKEQFSDYGGVRGVITVNKANIKIQKQIEELKKQDDELLWEIRSTEVAIEEKEKEREDLLTNFEDECFKKTTQIRNDFDKVLTGKSQKKSLAKALLKEHNPSDIDLGKLKRTYDKVYDDAIREYPMFSKAKVPQAYKTMPGYKLLEEPIVSKSNSSFAQFVRALHATDWIRSGRDDYLAKSEGKCPFCQKPLDDDFEEELADCFDEIYQKDMFDLHGVCQYYRNEYNEAYMILEHNLSDTLPSVDLTEYRNRLRFLEKNYDTNVDRLNEKIKEPSKVISLEETDSIILELNILVDNINQEIKANNDMVENRHAIKDKCRDDLIRYLAFFLADDIKNYRKKETDLDANLEDLNYRLKEDAKKSSMFPQQIATLESQMVDTASAMDAINRMLVESGFQGFRLQAKNNVRNTYEVIRENGEIASDLSEGEHNFIAFLYFYQLVCGSYNQNKPKDKIVVIDDPVSSMDSNAMFFISGIVKTMIGICKNNADYRNQRVSGDFIKQIFILTHNVYFHTEVTRQQVRYYDCTSFYMIRKNRNISTVKFCERKSPVPTEMENYNPVQNSYTALWDELKEVQSTNAAKNVMRRILDYYFLQLCGYESQDLYDRILESENSKNKFIVQKEDGNLDMSNYEMAMSLLAYIDTENDIGDDFSYTENYDNIEAYKNVFRLIFEALGQSQHYNMMMGVQKEP